MCVVSMVYDSYTLDFKKWQDKLKESLPHYYFYTDFKPIESVMDLAALKQLIEDFKKAVEAAKVVDKLTGQPDCADPEKAKLEARVVELEKQLAALKPKRKRKAKRSK